MGGHFIRRKLETHLEQFMIIPTISSKSRKTSFYSVFDTFYETSIVLEKEIFVLVKMIHTDCKEKERSKQTKKLQ